MLTLHIPASHPQAVINFITGLLFRVLIGVRQRNCGERCDRYFSFATFTPETPNPRGHLDESRIGQLNYPQPDSSLRP